MRRGPYTLFHFLIDCFLFLLTSGLWLIWIVIREMQIASRPRYFRRY